MTRQKWCIVQPKEAYYNLFKKELTDSEIICKLEDLVSEYAIFFDEEAYANKKYSSRRYREVIPEIISCSNKNDFVKECILIITRRLSK